MRYVLSFVSLWLLVTLVGCQKESFLEEGEGDKVALEFDLYQANVTKAAAVSALNDKALIKVYAFKVETKTETGTKTGTGETGTPSAEGTYVVGADGKVTAQSGKALFLYRGVYNLYFTSYNEENAPELGDGNLVTVQWARFYVYVHERYNCPAPESGTKHDVGYLDESVHAALLASGGVGKSG